jgi:hypothetical protein
MAKVVGPNGIEFDVADDVAKALTRHGDIELVETKKPEPKRAKREPSTDK